MECLLHSEKSVSGLIAGFAAGFGRYFGLYRAVVGVIPAKAGDPENSDTRFRECDDLSPPSYSSSSV
jgi:hypothetical protein